MKNIHPIVNLHPIAQALYTANVHGELSEIPRSDWKFEVVNDDTSLGYWEWLSNRLESTEEKENNETCILAETKELLGFAKVNDEVFLKDSRQKGVIVAVGIANEHGYPYEVKVKLQNLTKKIRSIFDNDLVILAPASEIPEYLQKFCKKHELQVARKPNNEKWQYKLVAECGSDMYTQIVEEQFAGLTVDMEDDIVSFYEGKPAINSASTIVTNGIKEISVADFEEIGEWHHYN